MVRRESSGWESAVVKRVQWLGGCSGKEGVVTGRV